MNEIWRKLSLRNKIHFVTTTLAGILWIAYALSGYPLGELPGAIVVIMWLLTGVVAARLFIVVMMMMISIYLEEN